MSKRSKRGKKESDSEASDLESLKDDFEEDEKSFSEESGGNNNNNSSGDDKPKKKKLAKNSNKNTKSSKKQKSKRDKISSSEDEESDDESNDEEGDEAMSEEEEEEGAEKEVENNSEESENNEEEGEEEEEEEDDNSDQDENYGSKTTNKKKADTKKKKQSPKNKIKFNIKGRKRNISDVEEGEVEDSNGSVSSSDESVRSTLSSVFNDGYDSEMLGDDDDRKRMDDLTEKEREQEIYQRTEQRDLLMRQFEVKKRIKQKEKEAKKVEKKKLKRARKKSQKMASEGSGSENRTSQSKTKMCTSYLDDKGENTSEDEDTSLNKSNTESIMDRRKANESKRKDTHVSKALANLKADREKKKQQAEDNKHRMERLQQQQSTKARHVISSSSNEDGSDSDKKHSKKHHHTNKTHHKNKRNRDTSDSDTDEEASSEEGSSCEDEDVKGRQPIGTKEELNRVKLSRFRIEKWVHAPFFKKIALGCFVRIGIGLNAGTSIYRVAEILDVVETSKVYTLGSTKTNKGFKLRHGEDERTYRLEFVSNQMFVENEFNRWKESMTKANIPLPLTGQIETKSKELKAYNNYRFNDEDIDFIINEKKRFSQKSDKIAEKKIELLKEREEAEQLGETERVREIDGLINDLNNKQDDQMMKRNGSFNLLANINQRNREESNKRVEEAMRFESNRIKETGDDPFRRRKGYLDVSEALKRKKVPILTPEEKLLAQAKEKEDEAAEAKEKAAKAATSMKKSESAVFYEDLLAPVSKQEEVIQTIVEELPSSYDVLHTMKKKVEPKKENTQNDLFMAHNFDININLGVASSFPSAALESNNGNRFNSAPMGHLSRRALNLDEYKKKKGLI